ncbi:hypothetical protein BCV70DRAFT_198262 [Testicularia cyperi]|uniref:DDHD domain-containing protein n=1 Tax=Testicularia cyperi TaxID=1882483 RepID=A0A317XVP2_9BASI|nr:hypothetical protein BCV70DRAFT_198262 [Testicularia cyperi]
MPNQDDCNNLDIEPSDEQDNKQVEQSSKERRADFIRQASQPLLKRNKSSQLSRKNSSAKSATSSVKSGDAAVSDSVNRKTDNLDQVDEVDSEDVQDSVGVDPGRDILHEEEEETEDEEDDEGPSLHSRWLHALENGKGWISFSVRDSRRLEAAWQDWTHQKGGQMELPQHEEADGKIQLGEVKGDDDWRALNPEDHVPSHRVPVGADMLYDADFEHLTMTPVFWRGPKLQIYRSTWFFESNKLSPCASALAAELESQFQTLRPWLSSYTDELKSSVSLGAEAEDKLKCRLKSLKNSYVIFQGPRLARLYTEGFPSRLSKQLFTAWSGEHGGGQLLIRGYSTQQRLTEAKQGYTARNTRRKDSRRARAASKDETAGKLRDDLPQDEEPQTKQEEAAPLPVLDASESGQLEEKLAQALCEDEQGVAEEGEEVRDRENKDDAEDSGLAATSSDPQSQGIAGDPAALSASPSQPSLNVDKTHARAETDTSKMGAGAKLRHLSRAAAAAGGFPSSPSAPNELLRSVATRLGVWTGGSDSPKSDNVSGTLTPVQQQAIDDSFKEAQRRMQELPDAASLDEGERSGIEEDDTETRNTSSQNRSKPTIADLDDPEAFDDMEQEEQDAEESDSAPELLLAVHGIGQRLAAEWKSFDFTLAINTFRALLQARIDSAKSPSEIGGGGLQALAQNRRIQVLPILWQTGFHEDEEAEASAEKAGQDEDSDTYDNGLELQMDHIFGDEGIPIVRTMVKDVLMDIPMYLSKHQPHVVKSVIREANRQYRLFVKRNPAFEAKGGRIHIVAHSLGTVISTDVLSQQPNNVSAIKDMSNEEIRRDTEKHLLFNVHNFFALGSPVALFYVVHRAQLIARRGRVRPSASAEDRSGVTLDDVGRYGCMAVTNFYNIWNQYDPVSTRVTPCVDVEYAKLLKAVPIGKVVRSVLRADPEAQNTDVKSDGSRRAELNSSASTANAGDGGSHSRSSSMNGPKGFFGSWGRKAGEAATNINNRARRSRDRPTSASSQGGTEASGQEEGEALRQAEDSQVKGAGENVEDLRARILAKAKEEEEKRAERQRAEKEHKKEMSAKRKERAEARLRALNPLHRVDFYLPVEGYGLLSAINQYAELMTAHMNYWTRPDLADFLITQILSDEVRLDKSLEYRDTDGW